MNKKEQLLSAIQSGKISLETIVDRLLFLEDVYSKSFNLTNYQKAFEEFIGSNLNSYCNGFFSKDYDLNNYRIISVNAFGSMDEPCTNIIVKHKETDDILEEKIFYPFADSLEMLCKWTNTDEKMFVSLLNNRGEIND